MFESEKSEEFIKLLKTYNVYVKDNEYSVQFLNYYSDREKYNNYINYKIQDFVNKKLNYICEIDVNGIVNNFEYLINLKLDDILELIGIKEIFNLDKKKYRDRRNIYNKYLYDAILNEKRENQNNNNLINYFENNLLKSNNLTLITLLKILEKIKNNNNKYDKSNKDINILKKMVSELFDDDKYINNLIEYINAENEYDITNGIIKKKNIKYLILNMKCNGYMFYNNYLKSLYVKYLIKYDIEEIKNDKKIVNYFIFIMKDSKIKVSIIINKLLLSMKDYLNDVEDNYYNMINYNKIDIKLSSGKYTSKDLKEIKRSCVYFNISKYVTKENEIICDCNTFKEIKIYSDILKSYYDSRYLDRIMEIDYIESFVKIKMNINSKKYIFDMNLLQYTILKLIYDSKEINLNNIKTHSNINEEFIEKILNGFLKLELIKRTKKNINETIFSINDNFYHEKSRLNIVNKINKINIKYENNLFQKDEIIYCNIIDILKKSNKQYNVNELYEILCERVPFKVTEDELLIEIKKGINIEHITKINIDNDSSYKLEIVKL
jgi:hypothetical protein